MKSQLRKCTKLRFRFTDGTALILVFFITTVASADIIYMKNGRQIECDSAWEEGKEVRYKLSNGIVGIPRSLVSKIVKTEPAKKPIVEPPPDFKAPAPTSTAIPRRLPDENTTEPSEKAILADHHSNEGIRLVDNRDFPGALESFKKAYQFKKNEETSLNLALIYYALKDDFNSESYFHEALRKNPKNNVAYNFLAEIAWRKEDLPAAQNYWQKSLAIRDDPVIRQKLERVRKEQAASAGFESTTSRHFLIRYDGGEADRRLVQELSDLMEDTYQQLSSQFETYPSEPFVVVLYPRQQFFKVMDLPLWSAGANDGKIKLPVKGLTTVTEDLKNVFVHELSHSFVDLKTSGNCPSWLQEGLAEYSEGARSSVEGKEILTQLIQEGQLPSFSKLKGSFAGANSQTAAVLYLQSLDFVEYIIERYQFYQLNMLLDELGKSRSFPDSFENTFGISLAQMEEQWHERLLGK